MFSGRAAAPASHLGYTRTSTMSYTGGTGSGYGPMAQGTAAPSQGTGPLAGMASGWEPSVLYLIGVVIAELILFHLLGRVLK